MKNLLTKLGQAGWENIWLSVKGWISTAVLETGFGNLINYVSLIKHLFNPLYALQPAPMQM